MINVKQQYLLLLFFCVMTFQGFGQVFTGISQRNDNNTELNSKFKSYELFTMNPSSMNTYVKDKKFDYQIQLRLGQKKWDLELFPHDMRSSSFIHTLGLENGETKLLKQENFSYIGHLKNGGAQKAVFTIMEGFFMGYIQDGGEEYFIEQAKFVDNSLSASTYIVYKGSDVIYNKAHKCGFDIYKHQKGEMDVKTKEEIRKRKKVESRMECWELDVALACDWAYVTKHNGNAAAEGFMFGILSLCATNWDDEFADRIDVVGGAVFSTACAGCDPWSATTSAVGLLNEFTSWGNGGGFNGGGYDDATLWTDRDFNGGTVGIAWLNGVCNNSRYNCCQDFTSGTGTLKQVQSHEIGHNYGLPHVNGPFIMAPSVNGSDTWSGASIDRVNSFTPYGCMSDCIGVDPPIADFTSSYIDGCVPFDVDFEDLSTGSPISWFWEFEGGNPSTSTQKNPSVEYIDKGMFQVRLTVTNGNGSDVKNDFTYINALDVPEADYTFQIDQIDLDIVEFTDLSVDPETWEWDFDDGSFSDEQHPRHTYAQDGEYYVTLTVTNLCGVSEIEMFILIVTPVVAKFATDTIEGCTPFYTTFADLSSVNVEHWSWVFDGGTPKTSKDKNPRVKYEKTGVYDVFLTVKNKQFEDTLRLKKYIKVDSASIGAFIDTMDVDDSLTIHFMNESVLYDSVTWSFEDTLFLDDSVTIYFASLDDSLRIAVDSNAEVTLSSKFHDDTLSAHFLVDSAYKVTIVTHQHCGNDTVERTIIAGKLPIADFDLSSTQYCVGDMITLIDNSTPNTTRWEWTVTNSNGSNSYFGRNPQITLTDEGQYTISLIAKNGLGQDVVTKMNIVEVVPQTIASFTSNVKGQDVDFVSTATNANTHAWNFGDNMTSNMADPTHTFAQSGTYLVQYIVTNNCNADTVETEVMIDDAPNAAFSVVNQTGCAPMEVQFTNNSSANSTSWKWTFSGGTPASSSDRDPLVRYENAGVFDVILVATNGSGEDTESQSAYIILDDMPLAKFDIDATERMVTFTDRSTGMRVTYEWDFGDGNKSADQNPIHTYTKNGKYNVSLKVTNECGSNTFIKEVTVTSTNTSSNDFVYDLTIAPNPTKGQFNIYLNGKASNSISVEVMSVMGMKVWNKSVAFGAGSLNQTIDISTVPNGTYYIILKSQDQIAVRKIIVQH